MTVTIGIEPVRQAGIIELIALSDAYMNSLYPPEGNFAVDIDALEAPSIRFAVARLHGDIVGCCGIKLEEDGTAEIKRLFVHEKGRGHGLAKGLMAFVEDQALQHSVHTINLETGPLNVEAVKLYEALGYKVCGPFGAYEDNPYSLFMTKPLASRNPANWSGQANHFASTRQ
jgi:putative acetyltransferase